MCLDRKALSWRSDLWYGAAQNSHGFLYVFEQNPRVFFFSKYCHVQLKAFINFPKRIGTSIGLSQKILFSPVNMGFMDFFFHIKKRPKKLLLLNNRDSVQGWHELCIRVVPCVQIIKNSSSC